MADFPLVAASDTARRMLHDRGLTHLRVRVYGKHVIIHSGEPADRENRARLTQVGATRFRLDMAVRDRWESTPYLGTTRELLTQLIDEFGFVLAPW